MYGETIHAMSRGVLHRQGGRASSIAVTPALVAGIFTIMFGARPLKATACSTNTWALRWWSRPVWMDSRPLRQLWLAWTGSSWRAAATDSSATTAQPISSSDAVGRARARAAMRGSQVFRSLLMAVSAMTGLQVAPNGGDSASVSLAQNVSFP